ncbi:tetratricopeptide repeat protein [Micromonospora soli]|uniref:alpha/beta hydrolase n=1 Tax=Micromonospora sp. NBRC 110009 TaxID=3061627 RepID=UPI002673B3DD|nr:alpha/beta fold hydrolase [Micromonospora sp. NBRC 110009]WKU02027.1 tetratricopeptide repeat protein [Micromonospora sp. NBRC 110009]
MNPVDLVFVHGLFSSRRAWEPMDRLLAGDPDLPPVRTHFFEYDSQIVRLRPDRRIPHLDDIADRLGTYLRHEVGAAARIVLVSHSQGGLVIQRFLVRTLARGGGYELGRIRRVLMYACPNSGSQFFSSLRRLTFPCRNPQERELRPLTKEIAETSEAVQRTVLRAQHPGPHEWPLPITAYAGISDNIVPPFIATGTFSASGVVDGDHFSVIRPSTRDDSRYLALRTEVLAAAEAGDPPRAPSDPGAARDAEAAPATVRPVGAAEPRTAPDPTSGRPDRAGRISVEPPLGRLDSPLYGRDQLIDEVTSDRRKPGQPPSSVHVLHGLPGSGKSYLALEIARRARRAGRQVWWVSAQRLSSNMREVASRLGAPSSLVDRAWSGDASATDLVWRFLDKAEQQWVLIIDNADEPRELDPVDNDLTDGRGWLRPPRNPANLVVVTSRDGDRNIWPAWSRRHAVRPLKDKDGALVLLDRAGGAAGTEEQARALSATLGGLPLSLRAVGDYLKSVHTTQIYQGKQVQRDFESYRSNLQQRLELTPGAPKLAELTGLGVTASVFEISLELLAKRGLTQAGNLLRVLACLSQAPVPYYRLLDQELLKRSPLFSEFTGQQQLTVLEGLADLSLVTPDELEGVRNEDFRHVLSLHPLVHGILRDDRDLRQQATEYYALATQLLVAAVRDLNPDAAADWDGWYLLAPHTIGLTRDYLRGSGIRYERLTVLAVLELVRLTARYLLATGLALSAEEMLAPVVDNCQAYDVNPADREILALRHELARAALEQQRPAEAEALLREVIAGRQAVLGSRHADTLASRHKLGRAIMAQNRWAEAEKELTETVAAEDKVRGPEHSDTMIIRHSLARAVLLQGRTKEAEDMLREILDIRLRQWAPLEPETLLVRLSLARCLFDLSRFDEAEEQLRAGLAGVGKEEAIRPEVFLLRWTLAQVLIAQNGVAEAREVLTRLLEDRERVLGETHPDTVATSETLEKLAPYVPPRQPGKPEREQGEPTGDAGGAGAAS